MKVVILEDEKSALKNLKHLISEVDSTIQIVKTLDTLKGAVEYFSQQDEIDLAFFDIHLADGNSFEIFNHVQVNVPIIFTTAYDEYALKAFKVNSIDYLLKPIDEDELKEAIEKFKSTKQDSNTAYQFKHLLEQLSKESKKYKSTFLVSHRDKLIPVDVTDIAYITIDSGIVKAVSFDKKGYIIDEKLEDIQSHLDPGLFFRANRQFIIQKRAIKNMMLYFNGKLILNIDPKPDERIIVSKAKAPLLKDWIN